MFFLRKIFIVLLIIYFNFCLVFTASAKIVGNIGLNKTAETAGYQHSKFHGQYTSAGIIVVLGKMVEAAMPFLSIIFLGLIIYAGYLWTNARGEDGEIQRAQKMIQMAIIGFIILLSAYVIADLIVRNMAPLVLQQK